MISAADINANIGALPPGTRGFDCNVRLAPQQASAFYDAGYRFAVRYVRRAEVNNHDLTTGEVLGILGAGLGLMVVQHVAKPGWMPSASLGAQYGVTAGLEARAVGIPRGVTLWCDLEEVDSAADASSVIGYCNSWSSAVQAAGYSSGLYVGDGCGLSAQDLYWKLRFALFWGAFNINTDNIPAVRGLCMRQRPYPSEEKRVAGVPFEYDEDLIMGDALGGAPTFLLPWAG